MQLAIEPTRSTVHRAAARAEPGTPPALSAGELVVVGAGGGLAAGGAMAAALMAIGEISSEPTAVEGIESSTWTALTSITSFLFGSEALHGSFHVGSIAFGLAAHLAFSLLFGVLGTAFIVVTQGPAPGPAGAVVQGVAWGLFLQISFLNLIVGAIQDVHTVYESIPRWGWWIAHAAYGATLGLLLVALFRRGRPG